MNILSLSGINKFIVFYNFLPSTSKFIRKKRKSLARTNALMVCEGPNIEDFMLALKGIVIIVGEAEPETNL